MSKPFKIPTQVIYICTGSKCKKQGGKELCKLFRDQAKSAGLKDTVEIIKTDCTDRCKFAPVLSFQPQNVWLHNVAEYQVPQLFKQYLQSPANPAPGSSLPR
ncbi:(2Fe-2S) ferredoxin domain-containing protein [Adhaeribacter swui]|uniref:(2Fe-2S) ferredoxin domain-containing protein n=1 Tax=Adhaeribacter swui TaxID=2086471 RepID=A0A7G7G483_9BACT|nr:(2Fe-2S) ferredoxin domain-containing protein [Adhaeribacter swui]QNF31967.1 (2Fe-2S) ferredoxin domain-containing protein [Adhaeribacter swui]